MTDAAVLLVFTTCPDEACAQRLARAMVEARLAACASVQAPARSFYHWQGAIEDASEVPLLLKTTAACYPALEAALRERHPYEVPEILAIPASAGLPAYLQWVQTETRP